MMIDSYTGERVIVHIDKVWGPYFCISKSAEATALEDVFDDYCFTYWPPSGLAFIEYGGNGGTYYFGSLADPVKLQLILDGVNFGS